VREIKGYRVRMLPGLQRRHVLRENDVQAGPAAERFQSAAIRRQRR